MKQLGRDCRGVAAVDFALWSVLILGALLPFLDFGLYIAQNARLNGAVGQATILAYDMRASAINTAQLSTYVTSGSGGVASAVSATITCNGGSQSCAIAPSRRDCACPTGISPVAYVVSASCGSPCASGATSGFFLTVAATRNFQAFVPDRWLNGRAMTSAATVRLQ